MAITADRYYDMNHPEMGIALIFCHRQFSVPHFNLENREHYLVDAERVKKTFQNLGFVVKMYKEQTFRGIQRVLNLVSREDHSKRNCLAVIVLTHGMEGSLFAKDTHYRQEELWEPFVSSKCKTLSGKPKLFFIQACRGCRRDRGFQPTNSRVFRSYEPYYEQEEEYQQLNNNEQQQYLLDLEKDFLVTFSTVPGYVSWRRMGVYAWFIEKLCDLLSVEDFLKEYHLLQVLTFVIGQVALNCETNHPKPEDRRKQIPQVASTLTKLLHLKLVNRVEELAAEQEDTGRNFLHSAGILACLMACFAMCFVRRNID